MRIASGLKPARAADKLMHRRMRATLLADGLFDGVRVLMKPTDKGDDMLPVPAAQVGFRRPGQDWVFLTEREWSREAIAAASAGSNVEVRLFAESGELDRLRNKLAGFGFEINETYRALDQQVAEGRATVQFDFVVDTTMRRAAAKIAFNYAARVLGGDVMRRSDFDAIRSSSEMASSPIRWSRLRTFRLWLDLKRPIYKPTPLELRGSLRSDY